MAWNRSRSWKLAAPSAPKEHVVKIRIGRVITGAVALAAAAVMTTATSASASENYHVWTESGLKLEVWEHGDVVRVTDTAANGHSAWVTVCYWDYSRCYTLKAASAGDYVERSASNGGVYNLPEGGNRIRLNWNGDGGTVNSSYFDNDL